MPHIETSIFPAAAAAATFAAGTSRDDAVDAALLLAGEFKLRRSALL